MNLIGKGAAHNVYMLDENRVLKVSNGKHFGNAGIILERLQGLPFVPKLYDYAENGDWHIMQYIDGFTPYHVRRGMQKINKKIPFNYEEFEKDAIDFMKESITRGYEPNDINASNVMVDWKGGIWVIDYDFFLGGEIKMTERERIRYEEIEQEFKKDGIYEKMKPRIERAKQKRIPGLIENDRRLDPLLKVGKEIENLLS